MITGTKLVKLLIFIFFFLSIGQTSFAGFPATPILDDFNRANEGPPPSANWTKPTYATFVGIKVVSNAVVQDVLNTNDGLAYWNVENFGPDCEAYVTINSFTGTDAFLILHVRMDVINGNGYKLDWNKFTGNIRVFRIDAGVRTQLGASIAKTVSAGDSLGILMVGNVITVYYKASGGSWVDLATRTDSTYTAAGKIMLGIWNNATVSPLDNFGGGTVTTKIYGATLYGATIY